MNLIVHQADSGKKTGGCDIIRPMKENLIIPTDNDSRRCLNCEHGEQIVAATGGKEIEGGGTEIVWYLVKSQFIGLKRNCFSWLEKQFSNQEIFIYPEADDHCVNPKRFEPIKTPKR